MVSRGRKKPIAWDRVGRLLGKVAIVTVAIALVAAGAATAVLGNERFTALTFGATAPGEGRRAEAGVSDGPLPGLATPGTAADATDYDSMFLADGVEWGVGPGPRAWQRFTILLPFAPGAIESIEAAWAGNSSAGEGLMVWNFTSGGWSTLVQGAAGPRTLRVAFDRSVADFVNGSRGMALLVATPGGGNATVATDFLRVAVGRPGAFFVYLGTALFVAGFLSVVLAMILGLISAPPRVIVMAPKGRGATGMPRKDPLEPSREQFLFTLILFFQGLGWLALSYLITLV